MYWLPVWRMVSPRTRRQRPTQPVNASAPVIDAKLFPSELMMATSSKIEGTETTTL